MTREEIFGGPASSTKSEGPPTWLLERRKGDLESPGLPRLVMRFEPVPPMEDLLAEEDRLVELFSDPKRSGNHAGGWHHAGIADFRRPHHDIRQGSVRWFAGGLDERTATVFADGRLELALPLRELEYRAGPGVIWPIALISVLAGGFRLAAELYRPRPRGERVWSDVVGIGIAEWRLLSTVEYWGQNDILSFDQSYADFVSGSPDSHLLDELVEHPDRLAIRWITRLWRAYGLSERRLPPVVDLKAQRVVFPGS